MSRVPIMPQEILPPVLPSLSLEATRLLVALDYAASLILTLSRAVRDRADRRELAHELAGMERQMEILRRMVGPDLVDEAKTGMTARLQERGVA